jgi:(1->4)-alpha-D-glucan 1-alpha-D-glucosylmutase
MDETGHGTRGRRIPIATYRLQFNRDFTFEQAAAMAEYLRELGISDCYASPLFQAPADSTHGYNVCCFGKVNPHLGGAPAFERFTTRLRGLGLGLLLDMVPNHMGAAPANAWWFDVLEHGHRSRYAGFFDINWKPENGSLRNKVLLPILEDHYAKVLQSGKLRLEFNDEKFLIAYHDRRLPVNARSLPPEAGEDPQRALREFNGVPGDAHSFDRLDALIQQQHYRLAYWRVGAEEINYRRFFDVNELVSLRMESPEVFAACHELVFQWLKEGRLTGLRIDHPDGGRNPKQYFERLRLKATDQHPESGLPLYVVAEKILSGDEPLPAGWQVDGTTGYDFLNRLNGIFVDRANEGAFDKIYREFTGCHSDFKTVAGNGKRQVLETAFVSELIAVSRRLHSVAMHLRAGADFTFRQLKFAVKEVIAAFPVYRTYITEETLEPDAADRAAIESAVAEAKRHNPSFDPAAFDFLRQLLLLELPLGLDDGTNRLAREFVIRFQQLTGPAVAKGVEDTAFYNFNRLVSLNEVGGDPGTFGTDPAAFHNANAATLARWPHTLLATATHDTKRGEDLRARINVLSEMPDEWQEALARWKEWNADKKESADGQAAPCANDEYLLYQTLVGAWPFEAGDPDDWKNFQERIAAFMLKAVREAKAHTSWTEPDATYEKAVQEFTRRILDDRISKSFLTDLKRFQQRVAFFGQFNSLSQTLLKITSPGVPDFYQGTELWDFNLVDPDNRRPVDFKQRHDRLREFKNRFARAGDDVSEFIAELIHNSHSGQIKMFLIRRALELRNCRRGLYESGDYIPLSALGTEKDHLCAFARRDQEHCVITVVPRLVRGLTGGREIAPLGAELWNDTVLPLPHIRAGNSFYNMFTREVVKVEPQKDVQVLKLGDVLKTFPVALLVGE